MEKIYNELINIISKDRISLNDPMSKHTSFKIGGPADIFININELEELRNVLQIARKEKVAVTCIGNGTNLLVKDKGIRGITIKLNFKDIKVEGENIEAGSGVAIPVLAKVAYENSLSGLEFASGIPGTVGGAIKMNAGAYGGEFGDLVRSTTYLDKDLNLKTISREKHNFSYRNSIFSESDDIIISTRIKLQLGNKEQIQKIMEENKTTNKHTKCRKYFQEKKWIYSSRNYRQM